MPDISNISLSRVIALFRPLVSGPAQAVHADQPARQRDRCSCNAEQTDGQFYAVPGTFISVDAGQQYGHIAKTDGQMLVLFQPGADEHVFIEWETQVPKGPEAGALQEKYGVTRPPRLAAWPVSKAGRN